MSGPCEACDGSGRTIYGGRRCKCYPCHGTGQRPVREGEGPAAAHQRLSCETSDESYRGAFNGADRGRHDWPASMFDRAPIATLFDDPEKL